MGLPGSSLTLLHLTDLHLSTPTSAGHYWNSEATELKLAPHDQRGMLGSLLDDLKREQRQPDLVIVTGDLLDRANDAGVPMAIDFLSALAERLRLHRERVVLVPGNHDVSRHADPRQRYASFDAIRKAFYGALRTPFSSDTPARMRVELFDHIASLGVEVVGFNSCEALDPESNQEHGSIGVAQRMEAERLLEGSAAKHAFRIAALHHHLARPAGTVRDDYSVMDDAELTCEWLARHRFHLALHGHQHVDWNNSYLKDGWRLSIVAGGSLGVARYGRQDWELPLRYQVILVDDLAHGRRVRREYDPQHRLWIAAGRGAAECTLEFGSARVFERLRMCASAGVSEYARWIEPPSRALSGLVSKDEIDRLFQITDQVTWSREVLLDAYRANAPRPARHAFDRAPDGMEILSSMVFKLAARLHAPDGGAPLLGFVAWLHHAATATNASASLKATAGALRGYLLDVGTRLGMTPADIAALQERANVANQQVSTRETHLVIKIDTREEGGDHYSFRAYRMTVAPGRDGWCHEDTTPLHANDDALCPLEELPHKVNEAIRAARHTGGLLTLELFVPVDLLCIDADQWRHKVSMGGGFRLGSRYRVVVRSLERSCKTGYEDIVEAWESQWRRFCDHPEPAGFSCFREHFEPERFPALLLQQGCPCAALHFTPAKGAPADQVDILAELIGAGTPVAVWPRELSAEHHEPLSCINALVNSESPQAWRDAVLRLRQHAVSSGDVAHPGSALTLLWDDPTRLPPGGGEGDADDARLVAPLKETTSTHE